MAKKDAKRENEETSAEPKDKRLKVEDNEIKNIGSPHLFTV